jgi:alanine transaminase
VSPPKAGEASYETFRHEKLDILETLERKAGMAEKALNSLPGITCSPIQGAMYAYPQVIRF